MEILYLENTECTPEIYFDNSKGNMMIKGRSYMYDTKAYLKIMIEWLRKHALSSPKTDNVLEIELEIIDNESKAMLYFLLEEINKFHIMGHKYQVNWVYNHQDPYMRELGQEIKESFVFPVRQLALA